MRISDIENTGGINPIPEKTPPVTKKPSLKGAQGIIQRTPTTTEEKISRQLKQVEAHSNTILGKIENISQKTLSISQELHQLEKEVHPSHVGIAKGLELKIRQTKDQLEHLKNLPKQEQITKGRALRQSLNGYIKTAGQLADRAPLEEKNALFKLKRDLTTQQKQIDKLLSTDQKEVLSEQLKKGNLLTQAKQKSEELSHQVQSTTVQLKKQRGVIKEQRLGLQRLLSKKAKSRQDLVKIRALREEITKSTKQLQQKTESYLHHVQQLHDYNTTLINDISQYARDQKFDKTLLKSLKITAYRNALDNLNSFREAQVGGESTALKSASNQFQYVTQYYASSLSR